MKIQIDKKPLDVLLLRSQEEQARGFMGVKTPPSLGTGLMFVYQAPQPKMFFWMKNVSFPLELLAFDKNGVLMQVAQLKANDHTPVSVNPGAQAVVETSPGFAKYAQLQLGSSLLQIDQ